MSTDNANQSLSQNGYHQGPTMHQQQGQDYTAQALVPPPPPPPPAQSQPNQDNAWNHVQRRVNAEEEKFRAEMDEYREITDPSVWSDPVFLNQTDHVPEYGVGIRWMIDASNKATATLGTYRRTEKGRYSLMKTQEYIKLNIRDVEQLGLRVLHDLGQQLPELESQFNINNQKIAAQVARNEEERKKQATPWSLKRGYSGSNGYPKKFFRR